jgi:hypothetical protein
LRRETARFAALAFLFFRRPALLLPLMADTRATDTLNRLSARATSVGPASGYSA